MMARPVSIVMLTHNNVDYTRQCVEALAETTEDYELIIVDNASSDGTRNYLTDLESRDYVKVILNPSNRGFAAGCNQGVARARHGTLCFLNNDTIPRAGWLAALQEVFEKGVGAVGSKLLYPDGTIQHAGICFQYRTTPGPHYLPYHRLIGESGDHPEADRLVEVPGVTAASLLTSRTVWERVGGMDEGYLVANFEDVDFNLAVRDAGFKVIYQPASRLVHFHGTTLKSKPDGPDHPGRYMAQNMQRLQDKWFLKLRDGLAAVDDETVCRPPS